MNHHVKAFALIGVICGVVLVALFREPLWHATVQFYEMAADRERLKVFLAGLGASAPAVFVLIQILQVIFAPFPGEVSGFIGGYLFGTLQGFIYSSIGLTVGSWINFSIGRFMGKRYIRKKIPAEKRDRFDRLLKRQGILVVFFLFVFPGFPKDYLCLFLGLSDIPVKLFLVMTAVGRMPGTLMLSLQGAALFEKTYDVFAGITILCVVMAVIAYRHRERFYEWAERLGGE
jgi:uncharacterized membrane protein YdjX (TVP38/TMEM64 family)